MLVCPSCREHNPEESKLCVKCGTSLEPGRHSMVSARRTAAPEIEISRPAQPPLWPRLTALTTIVVGGVAFAVWLAVKPNPCDGKFSSDRFTYCVAVPAGWNHSPARIGPLQVDQFERSETTAVVMSVPLPETLDLTAYATIARHRDKQAGLTIGQIRESRVGGTDALEWDLTDTKEGLFRGLEVVTVENALGWTIQLNASSGTFPTHVVSFRSMLKSWHFT